MVLVVDLLACCQELDGGVCDGWFVLLEHFVLECGHCRARIALCQLVPTISPSVLPVNKIHFVSDFPVLLSYFIVQSRFRKTRPDFSGHQHQLDDPIPYLSR